MRMLLLIAGGGAAGAVLRYWITTAVYAVFGTAFPWGTLVVNVAGSLLIGVLYVVLERFHFGPEWRALLVVGLLGAFTTFSTFSLETLALIEGGAWLRALWNILLSVTLCLSATALGIMAARTL